MNNNVIVHNITLLRNKHPFMSSSLPIHSIHNKWDVIYVILQPIASLVGFRHTKLAGCEISGLMIWINPENNLADGKSHFKKI